MFRRILTAFLIGLLSIASAFAHDLFLKPGNFFPALGEKVSVAVLNGSFTTSEGAVSFVRLRDASVVSPGGTRAALKETDFSKDEKTAFINLQPEATGNYIVGISTMAREIDLTAKDFNEYLAHDGIPDTLAERKRTKTLNRNVRERYSKHVKTIFQAGGEQTDSYKTALGYPVEIVPQQNPYALKAGDTLEILCLKNGKPLADQYVMSGFEKNGTIFPAANVRTNRMGVARIPLDTGGKWYVRFINMQRLSDPRLNYESNWAMLTFAVK